MRRDTIKTPAYQLLIAISAVEQAEVVLHNTVTDLKGLTLDAQTNAADHLWDEVDRRLALLADRRADMQSVTV
ncbi:MAG: hypothetical protein K8H84_11255 [Sulfuricella denitrificans]|nr:hypothetical protein [Sulfuricella denitrificans]